MAHDTSRALACRAALVLCCGALACVAAPIAPALAAPAAASARLHVAFAPDIRGRPTTIEMSLHLSAHSGQAPTPLTRLALMLPANMGIGGTTLGQANCFPADLFLNGLAGCSANALLGLGHAVAVLPSAPHGLRENAVLYALMGPPAEDKVEILFYVEASSPVFAQLVLPAALGEDTPPFGEEIVVAVPLVQAWPEGPDLDLVSLTSTIGPLHLTYRRRVGRRMVSFQPRGIPIPSYCPPGGYPFAARLGFADGASTTAYYRVPCPPR